MSCASRIGFGYSCASCGTPPSSSAHLAPHRSQIVQIAPPRCVSSCRQVLHSAYFKSSEKHLTIALEPTRAAVRLAAVFLVFDCLVFML